MDELFALAYNDGSNQGSAVDTSDAKQLLRAT
jgi:hypothetical protein